MPEQKIPCAVKWKTWSNTKVDGELGSDLGDPIPVCPSLSSLSGSFRSDGRKTHVFPSCDTFLGVCISSYIVLVKEVDIPFFIQNFTFLLDQLKFV